MQTKHWLLLAATIATVAVIFSLPCEPAAPIAPAPVEGPVSSLPPDPAPTPAPSITVDPPVTPKPEHTVVVADQTPSEKKFAEHQKVCPECGGDDLQPLCSVGFALVQAAIRERNAAPKTPAEWDAQAAKDREREAKAKADYEAEKTRRVDWFHNDYNGALAKAKELGRPLFIDFGPDWCGPCQTLKRELFAREDVDTVLRTQFVPLQIGAGCNSDDKVAALFDKLQHDFHLDVMTDSVHGVPACVVYRVGSPDSDKFQPDSNPTVFFAQLEVAAHNQESGSK